MKSLGFICFHYARYKGSFLHHLMRPAKFAKLIKLGRERSNLKLVKLISCYAGDRKISHVVVVVIIRLNSDLSCILICTSNFTAFEIITVTFLFV